MITLYRDDRVWSIRYTGDELIYGGGVDGGAIVEHSKIVTPKGGRDLFSQLELELRSRVSKQLDKGYSYVKGEVATNQLDFERPMLALPIAKARNISLKNAVIQLKLDGNRCLLRGQNGKVIAYSRQGKVMNLPHITEDFNLPEGVTIDGEVYCHGESLQTICSWIKRQQPQTSQLKFMAYDYLSAEPYKVRYERLAKLIQGPKTIELLACTDYKSEEQMAKLFRLARDDGYEGLILRLDGYGYAAGKRSKGLLKCKEWLDANYRVIDVVTSTDGLAVLDCGLFRVVCHGTHEYRRKVLLNKEDYIGRTVEIQFANWTAEGVPFQPTALRWIP